VTLRPLRAVAGWERPRRGALAAAFIAFEICYIGSDRFQDTVYNNYSRFAFALVHGRLWIDWPGPYIDAVLWHGYRYIVNDPVPGLLLTPFALVYGRNTNQTVLAGVMTAVATYFAYRLAQRLGASEAIASALTLFFLLGTDLFWCAALGDVWFVAQVCAMAFLTAAIYEILTRRRAPLVAVLFALAALSRFTIALSAPALAAFFVWSIDGKRLPNARRDLARFGVALAPFALLWIAYNEARWGVPYDSGHTIFFHQDAGVGSSVGSPFSLSNLPMQLYSFFIQAPSYTQARPYLVPELTGVALTFTSPALLLALRVRGPAVTVAALWLATFLAAGPSLLYYVNGSSQYGMRHAMDFEPYLFVLMILAVRQRLSWPGTAAIAWSCIAGVYGVWYWQVFVRA